MQLIDSPVGRTASTMTEPLDPGSIAQDLERHDMVLVQRTKFDLCEE